MARGEKNILPSLGLETANHVHAADISKLIQRTITNRSIAIGEAFNAVSDMALNLRGYAETIFTWFCVEPKIAYVPYKEWMKLHSPPETRLMESILTR